MLIVMLIAGRVLQQSLPANTPPKARRGSKQKRCLSIDLGSPSGAARCIRSPCADVTGDCRLLPKDGLDASLELWIRERLGEDVGLLEACVDLDKSHFLVLDHIMCEVLPDVNVLRTVTFPAADDVVYSLYARRVIRVLVHWCVGLLSKSHVG